MEIRDIKSNLSILTVLNYYHLKPGKNHMIKCPFHEDKDPSLKIYTDTNTFNCFGCAKAGDQIEFIQLKESSSKHDAILKAKSLANLNETVQPMKRENQEDKIILPRIAVLSKVAQDSKASFKRTCFRHIFLNGFEPLDFTEIDFENGCCTPIFAYVFTQIT